MLKQAKDHLDKRYHHILEMHDDTINDCTKICEKISEIMIVKYQSSFENIIITQINSACPKLKIIHKNKVTEYSKQSNIYTDNYVFDIIFKNHSLDVDDIKVNGDKLMYQNFRTIAQGEESDLKTLKQIILELISNKDIKKLTEEYHTLHEELDNKSTSFKREIRDLYYSVNGGMTLDKPKDCDICKSF